jgi:hypothetical protein
VHPMPTASDVGADASGAAASAVSSHNSETTNVHGIGSTADLVLTSDSRLSDNRTPLDGSVTDAKIVAGGLATSAITGTAVITSDSRLSDTRTPTDGTVTDAKIVAGGLSTTAITGTAVITSDARLSDARTPTAHAASHGSAGSDSITVAQSQVTNLGTDLAAKAPLASPTFSGTPAAPTAANTVNTTQLATTEYVKGQIPQYQTTAPSSPFAGMIWVDSDGTA